MNELYDKPKIREIVDFVKTTVSINLDANKYTSMVKTQFASAVNAVKSFLAPAPLNFALA